MTTGETIKKRRQELGLSVEDFAKATGRSVATVYRWENGSIDNYPVDTLIAIASALRTTPGNLLGNTVAFESADSDMKRDLFFEKYGALLSALDDMSEDDLKEVENFIKFKTSQSDE